MGFIWSGIGSGLYMEWDSMCRGGNGHWPISSHFAPKLTLTGHIFYPGILTTSDVGFE